MVVAWSVVAAACGGGGAESVAPTAAPATVPAPQAVPVSPSTEATTVVASTGTPAGSVAALAEAACDVLTSPGVVEMYASLTGTPIDDVRPCESVEDGERQLGISNTSGSGLVVLANFTLAERSDQLNVVGLYLPWVMAMNGVIEPADMRAAFPDDEISTATTAAGHDYLIDRSSDRLSVDVDGLWLTFNADGGENDPPAWPAISDGGELTEPTRVLVEAIVDALATS